MKPDARVLRCLCILQEPGFEPLLEMLEGDREQFRDLLVKCRDPSQLARYQGKAEYLDDLLIAIRNARNTLTKLDNQGR